MTTEDALNQIELHAYPEGTTSWKCALEIAACVETLKESNTTNNVIRGLFLHALIGIAHKVGYKAIVLTRGNDESTANVTPLCIALLEKKNRYAALDVAKQLYGYWFSDKTPEQLVEYSQAARGVERK